ncbi:hypothetical protein PCC7424_0122 [Gloeothece citriformis PCC 7424]|uniref:Uncharacterized protein n=1 Tax=Gloeothece citriformis (strain PCC 7424) TaxID=65393 RepID=B7K9A9_GLOC7|nr:hypothetical protein [Gloeothece citriformis]ACK68592.1 hypothetical protein PCC7424_0122 [Gloeothece citriformis PCC 7424]
MAERNIGIIGDGATDRQIFGQLVKILLDNDTLNIIELKRQNIRDHIDCYWKTADKQKNYDTSSSHSLELEKSVTNTLYGAFCDLEKVIGYLSNSDLLILTSDSERHLNKPEDYFQPWAHNLSKILAGAIDNFYRLVVSRGYDYDSIPVVVSVVTFPSTEIWIAAAQGKANQCYNKKARELKLSLYGTDDLRFLSDDDLKKKALDFLTFYGIKQIFKDIPESRTFIKILSLSKF